jgi:sarcosine oxidase
MALARRGVSVMGLDAFQPPHRLGSHHGRSRSVRRAYLEGTAYLSMALRAWELWRQLEKDTGEPLLVTTGNLTIGPPDAPALTGFLASARSGQIPHEVLSAADVRKRWPQLMPTDDYIAGLEVAAGIVFPENCIRVFMQSAEAAGAVLRLDEQVNGWTAHANGVTVHTTRGTYTAGRVLIAAGARSVALLGRFGGRLSPKRVPVHWIDPPSDTYGLGNFPVNFWQVPWHDAHNAVDAYREFYALPVMDAGGCVKAAFHNGLDGCNPDKAHLPVTAQETAAIRSVLSRFLPALSERPMTSDTCLYTMTPDEHFILGPLPENSDVFCVALAGHGFKFAPIIGEILADLIQGLTPAVDVGPFSPQRFSGASE